VAAILAGPSPRYRKSERDYGPFMNTVNSQRKRKVLPAYSHALPIHAKSGRERGPESACSLNGRQDDDF